MPRIKAADTSTVELPKHKPESIKRSHSAVTLMSLPTPPRTRKRKRSRSRHSRATDSGSELDPQDSDDEADAKLSDDRESASLVIGHKKRRMLRVDAIAAELSGQAAEDAFWMDPSEVVTGPPDFKGKEKRKNSLPKESEGHTQSPSRTLTRSPSSSPPAHLFKRTQTGLLSPPKSHRRRSPRKAAFPLPPTIQEEPETPPPKTALDGIRKKLFPERDSPNNPFLVSEGSSEQSLASQKSDPASGSSSQDPPRTPKKHVEKPTITYVFRGVRQEFQNPHYDPRYPETGVAPSDPDSPSNLPPEDPNFSPSEYCPPRLLFTETRTRRKRRVAASDDEYASTSTPQQKAKSKGKRARIQAPTKHEQVRSEWDTSDEEEGGVPSTPKPPPVTLPQAAVTSRPAGHRRAVMKASEAVIEPIRTRAQTRAETAKAVLVIPEKDGSDTAKRAFGTRERGKSWR